MGGETDKAAADFPAWHKWDRKFFLFYVLAAWGAILIGFYPSVTRRYLGQADFPAPGILQVHVFAFTAWMCLLIMQIFLIRTGQQRIHKRLGIAGASMVPILVITGVGAELVSQRFYSPKYPENLQFFIAPLFQMLVFLVCASMALLLRKDSAAHKRLILLGTSMILVAAYNRWWGEGLYQLFGDGFWGMIVHNFAGPNMLMAVAIAYDVVSRRRVHWVHATMVPAILLGELVTSWVYHHSAWPPIAWQLVGI
ncbi:MAG: hypothetical protein IPP45_08595 [Sphingomonadales bacterium]|nr:hypothetical protein [Sphingomonadales bacterium]